MTTDLSTVPLVALSSESKQVISILLNPRKIIPTENQLPRDWRGLAHFCGLNGEILPQLLSDSDPSSHILSIWAKQQKQATLKDFQIILTKIDRYDVLDDTQELLEKDAERYLRQLERARTSGKMIVDDIDEKVLTIDDFYRQREGFENQYYDAFLLYADEDINIAKEVVDKLENQYKLKLCLRDRDLIGGLTFEHDALVTLISERCNKLIVIITSNFVEKSEPNAPNQFLLNYATALGIEKRQRKIVPCLYGRCQMPRLLNYITKLDHNRAHLFDFWEKLRNSVQGPTVTPEKLNVVSVNENQNTNKKEDEENVNCIEVKKLKLRDENIKENKEENLSHSEQVRTQNTQNDKMYNQFIQWTKKHFTKGENNKKYALISETISLPSLENLDPLDVSSEATGPKSKTPFIHKCMKKIQLRKEAVKL